MGSNIEDLMNSVIEASVSKEWKTATEEWDITDFYEDVGCSSSCVCGKENLRYLFEITNRYNGNVLFPIGSKCIFQFNRSDLNAFTAVYESLFKLQHAMLNGMRIELNSTFFSRRLLLYLYKNKAFRPTPYNGFSGYNDYEFLLKMFNSRTPPTEKQQRKINAIIIGSVKPYLERLLSNRVLHSRKLVAEKQQYEKVVA